MTVKSIIITLFIKAYTAIGSLIQKSAIWHFLTTLNDKFNEKVKSSAIVYAFSAHDKFDDDYSKCKRYDISILDRFANKIFASIREFLDKSAIITYFSNLCADLISVPLVFPGIVLTLWGGIGIIGSFLKNAGIVATLICAALLTIGVVLAIAGHSIVTTLNNSFTIRYILKKFHIAVPDDKPLKNIYNYGSYAFVGALLGISTLIFGLIPTALVIILIIATVIFFRYTVFTAWLYVCILPFMPTMAMVLYGIALFGSVVVKCCLGYKNNLFADKYAFNMLLLFMGISFAIAAMFSFAKASSVKIAMVYIAFLCSSYALVKLFSTKKVIVSVLNGISAFSLPVSLFGIYQHFSGFDNQNTWIDTEMFDEISGRVVSFFGNPNVFGEYLILVIITSAVCFFISKNMYAKIIHLAAVAFSGVALVFTYSRGCWIGLIFAVVIFLFMSKRKMFAVFCILGLASIFFLPDSIISRITSVGNLADSSTSYRVYIWEGTINMLKDFWITGIGLGSDAFNSIYPLYAYSAITAPHPHNLYLVILTETGIVGAVAFILIIIFYYKRLFSIVRSSNDATLKTIASGLIAAISGYLLQGMFDNVWYNYRVFLMFWIYIAIGLAVDIVARRKLDGKN